MGHPIYIGNFNLFYRDPPTPFCRNFLLSPTLVVPPKPGLTSIYFMRPHSYSGCISLYFRELHASTGGLIPSPLNHPVFSAYLFYYNKPSFYLWCNLELVCAHLNPGTPPTLFVDAILPFADLRLPILPFRSLEAIPDREVLAILHSELIKGFHTLTLSHTEALLRANDFIVAYDLLRSGPILYPSLPDWSPTYNYCLSEFIRTGPTNYASSVCPDRQSFIALQVNHILTLTGRPW